MDFIRPTLQTRFVVTVNLCYHHFVRVSGYPKYLISTCFIVVQPGVVSQKPDTPDTSLFGYSSYRYLLTVPFVPLVENSSLLPPPNPT